MNIKYINELNKIPHKYPWLTSLYALILQFKPKNIIEYGTEYGGTAMVMALALKQLQDEENHKGKIYTYDTFEVQSKGEIGSVPNLETAKHEMVHRIAGFKDELTLLQDEFKKAYGTYDININDGAINYPPENDETDTKD